MKGTPDQDADLLAKAKAISRQACATQLPIYRGRSGLVPGIDPRCNRSMLDAADFSSGEPVLPSR